MSTASTRLNLVRARAAAGLRRAAGRLAPDAAPTTDGAAAAHDERALAEARRIGDDWREHEYYEQVEEAMDPNWVGLIFPFLEGSDLRSAIDLAAGHGRNTAKLLEQAEHVWVIDINEENIAWCRRRFAGDARVEFLVGDGMTLRGVPDASITLVYCFDAMVHFDSDSVRSYLRESARVLVPGGRAFFHHSNFTSNPGGDVHDNAQWRNFMSKELFAHYARKEGLNVVRQRVLDWGPDAALDCVSLVERPAVSASAATA